MFKDTNVSGLTFESGDETGITGADGAFTFEDGVPVEFSVGGVSIGSAPGGPLITPIDLVSGGTSATPQVQNIVRFLLMLDTDGDPSNGISISEAVRTMAEMWSAVDFTTGDLANVLVTIISDAASVDGTPHMLPDAATAQTHLESTLICTRSGAFRGTFTGDSGGLLTLVADGRTGLMGGHVAGLVGSSRMTLSGTMATSFDGVAQFSSIDPVTGAVFSGQFDGPDDVSGTWTVNGSQGAFTASRRAGASNAVYRFTGNFEGDDQGFFAFDVDSENNVTGVGYTPVNDAQFSLPGTVSGTTLDVTASDGTEIDGTLDMGNGDLSGTWDLASHGFDGTFDGSGCRLN
ncbi:MAG: hypothetical protein ACR2QQ_13335 [Gammaproteobacteria bacterium]